MINQGPLPTGISDGFSIQLPAPWQLDTTTISYPHDPGGADFTNVTGNTWYFNTGAGIIAGDSVIMTVTLRVPAAQVASLAEGNSPPIIENAVVRYVGFCSASGMPCPVSQITLNTNNTTSIYYSSSHVYYNGGPVLSVTNPAAVCAPQTINLTAAAVTAGSTTGLGFSYYTDAAGLNPFTSPAAVTNPGTYYIRGAGTVTGCGTDTLPVTVMFNYKPGIATSPDTSICKTGTALLGASSSPGATIQWTGLSGNPVAVTASGSYQVIATNAAGCKDTGTVNVTVVDLSAYLTATPNVTIQGKTVVLETTNKYQVVAWMPQSQFPNQTAATQSIVMGDSSQTFSVVLRSVNGCTDTATVRVTIDPTSFNIYVPNAFTPNFDGKNDVFYILGPTIKEIELRIFNQWGQQIFATKDKGRGWNGLFNGQPQPAGVYVYTVKAVLYNGTIITQKGTLLLIR
jgi:gliding motility-associated-like protein